MGLSTVILLQGSCFLSVNTKILLTFLKTLCKAFHLKHPYDMRWVQEVRCIFIGAFGRTILHINFFIDIQKVMNFLRFSTFPTDQQAFQISLAQVVNWGVIEKINNILKKIIGRIFLKACFKEGAYTNGLKN